MDDSNGLLTLNIDRLMAPGDDAHDDDDDDACCDMLKLMMMRVSQKSFQSVMVLFTTAQQSNWSAPSLAWRCLVL